MLSINMDDVMQVVSNIQNYLIAFGVVLVLALLVMFAVRKMPKAKKKMIRAQSGLAILLALVVDALFIFFVIKEVTIGIFALIAVTKSGENHGALIYGKVNTVLLYICLGLLLFWVGMPTYVASLILDIAFLSLLGTMTLYLIAYVRIILSHRKPKK